MPQYSGIWTLGQAAQAIKNQDWAGVLPTVVEYLVVAGGGSGGFTYGAGGGAGGLLQGFAGVAPGTSYFVTVGAGGASNVGVTDGNNGSASVFDATSSNASTGRIIATGGGGAGGSSSTATAGKSGGSGGGAGGYGGLSGGAGTSGQGNAGGAGQGTNANYGSGGGGGAGTVGFAGTTTSGGNGGAGIASDITGIRAVYAGGGGGGIYDSGTGGIGGVGGGGSVNPTSNTNGNPGQPNTGGGGSGNKMNGSVGGLTGGAGGSGIVVIRYPGNVQYFTGGTLNYSNGHIVHTFLSSGVLAPTAPRLFASPDYQISRSIRFNSPDGPILERAGSAGGNRQTWTWSGWVKRSKLNSNNANRPFLFGASDRSSGSAYLQFGLYGSDSDIDCLNFNEQSGGAYNISTQAKFRDTSAWYHVVCAYDTTQAVASDRVKIYVNGILQTITSGSTYPPQNTNGYVNYSAFPYLIGAYTTSDLNITIDGYMAEVNFVDGQQLTPASFGYTEPSTGVWTPLQYTGSYGTRGFYLNFADNSNTTAATLGKDLSGNANNFTPTNFSVTAGVGNDSLVDSPTNYGVDTGAGGEVRGNYCTWNPVEYGSLATLSNGNLSSTSTGDNSYLWCRGTIAIPTTGGWYWEVTVSTPGDIPVFGLQSLDRANAILQGVPVNGTNFYLGYFADEISWYGSTSPAIKQNGNNVVTGLSNLSSGDVLMFAYNTGKIYIGRNGTWINSGNPVAGTGYLGSILTQQMVAAASSRKNASGTAPVLDANFGQRAFAYTAPTGYKTLCTQNLPTSILPQTAFAVNTFTGSNSSRIIGTGIQSDLVLTKRRDGTYPVLWHDALRGAGRTLYGSDTIAEVNNGNAYIQTFNSDSYGIGASDNALNVGGGSFVSWTWNAGGTTVTNTAGTISAQVRANPAAGFSVVTFTATADSGSIGHGLGVAPNMIILKSRNNISNWIVYHSSLGANKYLNLNTTDSAFTNTATWQNTVPTSTVFYSNGPFVTGYTEVAYCWAEIAGYSKFGSYVGNGSTDGPFVYCGFRPRYVMYKCSSTTGNWIIIDTARDLYNVSSTRLLANTSDSEASGTHNIDILSNGFKLRNTDTNGNSSATTYIYAAYAESPFKYARAR